MGEERTPGERDNVDPRYDPVFQRSYDPARHPARPDGGDAGEGIATETVGVEAVVTGAPQPAARDTPARASDAAGEDLTDDADPGARPARFALGPLIAVSAGMLAVGALLLIAGFQPGIAGALSDRSTRVLHLLVDVLPPGLLLGGFVGIALTVLLVRGSGRGDER